MSHESGIQGVLEKAKAEGELVALTRYGIRHLLRHGYSLAELAPKKKKRRRGGKGGPAKKDEEFDMFELPDIGIGSVNDETLIYDLEEEDGDDD